MKATVVHSMSMDGTSNSDLSLQFGTGTHEIGFSNVV